VNPCSPSRRFQRGASLVEVLAALALSSICLGAAYGSVIVQTRRQAAQAAVSEAEHAGRLAFEVMVKQIANAGFGVPRPTSPSAAPMIVTANATTLAFWTNAMTAHTYLASAVAAGAQTLTVVSANGIAAGGSVYIADDTQWRLGTVQSVSGTTVRLAAALTASFAAGSFVLPVEQVTFALASGALQRNGRTIIPNVTALSFTYDSTTLTSIRVITVSMTVQSRARDLGGTRQSITLGTRIAPPNLAL
jgi:type II secretory pathway component PulJ